MAINKAEFFAWLRKTEGPREVRTEARCLSMPPRVVCLVADEPRSPRRQSRWVYAFDSYRRILSYHRTLSHAADARDRYKRWLNEFETTQGERDEG